MSDKRKNIKSSTVEVVVTETTSNNVPDTVWRNHEMTKTIHALEVHAVTINNRWRASSSEVEKSKVRKVRLFGGICCSCHCAFAICCLLTSSVLIATKSYESIVENTCLVLLQFETNWMMAWPSKKTLS